MTQLHRVISLLSSKGRWNLLDREPIGFVLRNSAILYPNLCPNFSARQLPWNSVEIRLFTHLAQRFQATRNALQGWICVAFLFYNIPFRAARTLTNIKNF